MFDLFAPLIIGFVGSLHCLGMCGPLVMAYSLHVGKPGDRRAAGVPSPWLNGLAHHLSFHLGRLFTYGLLGALAATLTHLARFNQFFSGLRSSLTLTGGILMILLSLVLLKVLPLPLSTTGLSVTTGSFIARWLPPLFRSRRLASKIALGLLTGFLPCMLSWAMIIQAATTQSPVGGFLTMFAFGMGTIPVLFFTGLSASLFSLKVRFLGERVAALSVMVMGFILVFKGARYFA
jgi:sulfite exporter TauE/SafE